MIYIRIYLSSAVESKEIKFDKYILKIITSTICVTTAYLNTLWDKFSQRDQYCKPKKRKAQNVKRKT